MYVKQKASNWTLFAFIALGSFTSPIYADNCSPGSFQETLEVAHVYDGDTIKLVDGRKLRLIGINTPERGRDGKKDQPFYLDAKNQLQQIIHKNNNRVKVVYGKDQRDRYKRWLAHIFTPDNKNIAATLIKTGMGFTIAIPPNIQFLKCYQDAELDAKKHKRGIWNHQYSRAIPVNLLKSTTSGFQQVKGIVQRVAESRSSFWLNLNSKFALRILKKDLTYFSKYHPKDLLRKQVIARGWIYKRKNEQRMTIQHPAALKIQNTD